MNNSDEQKKIAAALCNLDQAFALCFAVEASVGDAYSERYGLRRIRDAYAVVLDVISGIDALDSTMDSFDGESDFIDKYYSTLVAKAGLA